MRRKKFKNHLINKRYLVAVDGTQKLVRNYQWQPEALKRHVGRKAHIPQYYVYVLDSVLVLDNGIVLPVLSEILDNKGWVEGETKVYRWTGETGNSIIYGQMALSMNMGINRVTRLY